MRVLTPSHYVFVCVQTFQHLTLEIQYILPQNSEFLMKTQYMTRDTILVKISTPKRGKFMFSGYFAYIDYY